MQKSESELLLQLQEILRRLRSPEGCLWDRQQGIADIGRYLLEEAYEVIEAIDAVDLKSLQEELGDLLFQILFAARIAEETGEFSFSDVMSGVAEKMIRRHPHVFSNLAVDDVETIKANWKTIKNEKEGKAKTGLLEGIPRSLPALHRVQRITERASEIGFDWGKADDVLVKVEEELREFKDALKDGRHKLIKDEMGDLLFSLVNLCRFMEIDAEEALRSSLRKFLKRFKYIETRLQADDKSLDQVSLADMDDLWNQSKKMERDTDP
jgi:tetrapyrrole methylase family protein/MazG family protein